ncbi:predicted protein, partial [Haematococcus lacustris]
MFHSSFEFQNKFGAQRALLRNGESLLSSLIVGVKPLDVKHRAEVEGVDAAQGSTLQFQNKFGAQRALLRNGESLLSSLIVGVKPLDVKHRAEVEGVDAAQGSTLQVRLCGGRRQ